MTRTIGDRIEGAVLWALLGGYVALAMWTIARLYGMGA